MKWHTETRLLSELRNWEDNPRNISDEKFDELVSSVDDLGNFDPLIIDTDNTVIAGNQRLRALLKLGEVDTAVSVPERKLTEDEIKKIGILSNRHSGEWDMEKLLNFEDVLGELGAEDMIIEDMDFDDIEGTEDREKKFRDIETICPKCGESINIRV